MQDYQRVFDRREQKAEQKRQFFYDVIENIKAVFFAVVFVFCFILFCVLFT